MMLAKGHRKDLRRKKRNLKKNFKIEMIILTFYPKLQNIRK